MRTLPLLTAVTTLVLALGLGGCAGEEETSSDSTDALTGAPGDAQNTLLAKGLEEVRSAYNAADTNEIRQLDFGSIRGTVDDRLVNSQGFYYSGIYLFSPRASSSTYKLLVLKKRKTDTASVIWFFRNEDSYARELGSCVAQPSKPLTQCTPSQ